MRSVLFVFIIALAGCDRSPETVAYECESGRVIHASYPSESLAVVAYEGRTMEMTSAVSASGARYVGTDLEWWTRGTGSGSEGTLFRHRAGATGETVESCVAATE